MPNGGQFKRQKIMADRINVNVFSEIGSLEHVVVHTPGLEVERMSPSNAEKALYSDILNLEIARREYAPFKGTLQRIAKVHELEDLLVDTLNSSDARNFLLPALCPVQYPELLEKLFAMPSEELAHQLLTGVPMPKQTLTDFLDQERYAIPPLYNFYFMRDASMSVYDNILMGRMAHEVRFGESRIMEAIFTYSTKVHAPIINPAHAPNSKEILVEGGDVHIVRDDILMIGCGQRTSKQGIDFIVQQLLRKGLDKTQHILVQESPLSPGSFIHLDMIFTLLGPTHCMAFEPVIMKDSSYHTIHMEVQPDGQTKIRYEDNLVQALNALGVPVEPIFCGGTGDNWVQEREQSHSGANFVSFGPDKIIGYARNHHTIEALSQQGFEVVPAEKAASGEVDINALKSCVVTLSSSELVRGGGGGRCMTLPIVRKAVQW
ncbi:MAG: arginine deiminase [Bacteroidetes bacterium]|nr:MAG: arginine deiminase [Bacteroidota bacterium]